MSIMLFGYPKQKADEIQLMKALHEENIKDLSRGRELPVISRLLQSKVMITTKAANASHVSSYS